MRAKRGCTQYVIRNTNETDWPYTLCALVWRSESRSTLLLSTRATRTRDCRRTYVGRWNIICGRVCVCTRRESRLLRVPGKVPARDVSKCFWNIVPPGDQGGCPRALSSARPSLFNERKQRLTHSALCLSAERRRLKFQRTVSRQSAYSMNSGRVGYFGYTCRLSWTRGRRCRKSTEGCD